MVPRIRQLGDSFTSNRINKVVQYKGLIHRDEKVGGELFCGAGQIDCFQESIKGFVCNIKLRLSL